MKLDRRQFLKHSLVAASALVLPGGAERARATGTAPALVALFLRGGADGLTLVPPHGDPSYYALRPNLQVAPGSELDLDGFFGLHPALAPLLPLYDTGALAVLHAAGSPDPSRSHFDAQDFMETAAPGDKSVVDGWLNRFLASAGAGDPLAGVSLRKQASRAMAGPTPTVAFSSIARFALGGAYPTQRRAALEALYQTTGDGPLAAGLESAFASLDRVASVDTSTAVAYPGSPLASALRDAAALIKGAAGVRAVSIDAGGWDHHSDQLERIAPLAGDLAGSLAAFYEDLGPCADDTVTLVMTEFGRRPNENGALGADHGHGGMMLALGGGVQGGRVLVPGGWPGLAPGDLFDGEDLEVVTDFRAVFAEVLKRHMGAADLADVFPGYPPSATDFPGLFV